MIKRGLQNTQPKRNPSKMDDDAVQEKEESTSLIEFGDIGEATIIGLSSDKRFLTVGGRREHRVLKLHRDEEGKYTKIENVLKIQTRQRNSLEYGIFDVKWNPRKCCYLMQTNATKT
jgi:hypothetical protein